MATYEESIDSLYDMPIGQTNDGIYSIADFCEDLALWASDYDDSTAIRVMEAADVLWLDRAVRVFVRKYAKAKKDYDDCRRAALVKLADACIAADEGKGAEAVEQRERDIRFGLSQRAEAASAYSKALHGLLVAND